MIWYHFMQASEHGERDMYDVGRRGDLVVSVSPSYDLGPFFAEEGDNVIFPLILKLLRRLLWFLAF